MQQNWLAFSEAVEGIGIELVMCMNLKNWTFFCFISDSVYWHIKYILKPVFFNTYEEGFKIEQPYWLNNWIRTTI